MASGAKPSVVDEEHAALRLQRPTDELPEGAVSQTHRRGHARPHRPSARGSARAPRQLRRRRSHGPQSEGAAGSSCRVHTRPRQRARGRHAVRTFRARPRALVRRREAELRRARDDWLRRLETSRRSKSTLTAYRVAIVDHLAAYQRRAEPAPATYYRRFGLLRRFVHWLSRRSGLPDPFLELEPPAKPQQEADWLTEDEFARLLAAAEHPRRCRKGLAERDRLVLLALVQTSLRRSELIALDWCDVDLESKRPSLLVRQGKGAKPRRQPLAPQLADELRQLRDERQSAPTDPVFCGLEGKRLQPTILTGIISRAAEQAGLEKRITAHTLRHTAAIWLRQQTGRCPPRRRLPRPRRPLHRQPLRPRRRGRPARRGRHTRRSQLQPSRRVRPAMSEAKTTVDS